MLQVRVWSTGRWGGSGTYKTRDVDVTETTQSPHRVGVGPSEGVGRSGPSRGSRPGTDQERPVDHNGSCPGPGLRNPHEHHSFLLPSSVPSTTVPPQVLPSYRGRRPCLSLPFPSGSADSLRSGTDTGGGESEDVPGWSFGIYRSYRYLSHRTEPLWSRNWDHYSVDLSSRMFWNRYRRDLVSTTTTLVLWHHPTTRSPESVPSRTGVDRRCRERCQSPHF